jgi:hypothetical protein
VADPVLWPFAGAGDVSWQPEWLTEVLRPSAGLVQHRQLRDEPRVRVSFQGISTGQARRLLENLLERNGARRWYVPLPGAGFALGAALAVGATGVPGATAGTLLRAGGRVALVPVDQPRRAEVFTVSDVQPTGIVLAGNTVNAHPAGTRVLPVFKGRMGSIPTLSRFTGDAVPWAVEFELAEVLPVAAAASPVLYRSFPVLDVPMDWSSDPSWQPQRDVSREDNDTGPVWTTDLLGQSRPEIKRQCTAVDPGEVAQMLGQLWALAGRANPVWVHTHAHDLVLAAGMSAGSTTMDVEWAGLGTGPRPAGRRDLRIALRNGTVLHRRVTAVAAPSGNVERLTLDAAPGTALTPADVLQLSWMSLCTQSADVVRINWWKHDVAQIELSFQAVPYEH